MAEWRFEGNTFSTLCPERLGEGVISGKTLGSGGYTSYLPVSGRNYRRSCKNHARIEIAILDFGANITIFDDYGTRYCIKMWGFDEDWMEAFRKSAEAHELWAPATVDD